MTALTLALSLSNSFTKVGAIAAFLALAGIAILSLLVFSQAREIKRLREWAGRAPERAAEMEQRVSAGAAARVQRGSAPPTPQGRVVARTTPLVSAPVATAVSASAAAVTPPAVPAAAPAAAVATPAAATAASEQEKPAVTPAPVTAAAQGVTRAAPRAPLPPSPAAPEPAPPRSTAIPDSAATATAVGGTRKDFRQERSPTRAIVLGVGVLIVVVLVLIFAVSALKGGGSPTPAATRNSAGSEATPSSSHRTTTKHSTSHQAVAASPAETAVVVLNGTATAGLAHHLASDLKQSGYTQALASAAVPPGTHQSTVVEYSSGHRADAQGVARKLNVTQVQPMDTTIAGMVGSATVVVLAGADQAAQLGGGGAHSQGEPAATGSGESAAGSG
ncbi:MAG TPA: LytR C-terminal domain-containing protein [Solirubrobacteraceae bacterium]|nr:LytR C-terminal domain-containing protein [Solirubrobacteraceae bacterium]